MNTARTFFKRFAPEKTFRNAYKNIRMNGGDTMRTIQVTPDPANGILSVSYESAIPGIIRIKIFGFAGYEVHSCSYDLKPGPNSFRADCRELNDGVYILETTVRQPKEGVLTSYNKFEIKSTNL